MRRFAVPAMFALSTIALVATSSAPPDGWNGSTDSPPQRTVLTADAPEAVFDLRAEPSWGPDPIPTMGFTIIGGATGPTGDGATDAWIEVWLSGDAGTPLDPDGEGDAGTVDDGDAGTTPHHPGANRHWVNPGVETPFASAGSAGRNTIRVHFALVEGAGPVTLDWTATVQGATGSPPPGTDAHLELHLTPVTE